MIVAPTFQGLFDRDYEKAFKPAASNAFQVSLDHVREQLDELRDLGVNSFALAVVAYPPGDGSCPLQYPSLTNYRDGRTYTVADLYRVVRLQEAITVLVLSHIWDVVPEDMARGDALLVRVVVNLGDDWESTSIVGYAGAIRTVPGRRNEPFILK